GTVELLTREGEIQIAKRIEEGLRDVMAALAYYPGTVQGILDSYDRVTNEEDAGRLSDILTGYLDPDTEDNIPADSDAEFEAPAAESNAKDEEEDEEEEEEDDSSSDEETESGPDPEVARIRFGELRDQLEKARVAIEKHGRHSKQAQEELEALGRIFAPFKLNQRQFDTLVSDIRSTNDRSE